MLTEEDYRDFMDTFVDVFEDDEEFDLDELGTDYLSEGEDDFSANTFGGDDDNDDFDDEDDDDDDDDDDDE